MSESPQITKPENTKQLEGFDQFDRYALQAAREVYATETKQLQKRASHYKNLRNIAFSVAVPGALYKLAQGLGVDTGLVLPDGVGALIKLSWSISSIAAGGAFLTQTYFENKLHYLRDKFGMLKNGN